MRVKKITLNDYKNFKGTNTFEFSDFNLISGENGAGKSTLGLDSILFCLYGYSRQKLEKLVNRSSESEKFSVTVEFDKYTITRKYPVDIIVLEDGKLIEFPTNREAQKFINDKFQPSESFRKFRMLDISKGINILEQGSTPLLKTLFQYHQDCINNIRTNLMAKKSNKEKFNKESSVLYTIYPSEKRYEFIKLKYNEIRKLSDEVTKETNKLQSNYYSLTSQKSYHDNSKKELQKQKKNVQEKSACPVCKSNLSPESKTSICDSLDIKIVDLQTKSSSLVDTINQAMLEITNIQKRNEKFEAELRKLTNLKFKLETRIKQKDYIYTTKDVEILKRSVDALDKFSVEYVVKWIKGLEPIINDIIKIIDFKVEFKVDKKGNISINLFHEDNVYDYEDLSSGQRLLLTVGFQLAILLEKGEEGLLIADEGFSSLSEVNLDKLLEMIQSYPMQLIYIIHRINKVHENVKEIHLI